jgi:hypothetical protein
MPIYFFENKNTPPIGGIERFLLAFPGNLASAIAYAQKNGLGGQNQRFTVYDAASFSGPAVLCVQPNIGQVQDGRTPALSKSHVLGGSPTGIPITQPHQQTPAAPPDSRSGFQRLSDADLGSSLDPMFGDVNVPETDYNNGQEFERK